MRNHLMASIATKNKSEDRSKNEQFHFRQQKTKDKHDIFTNMKDKFFEVSALKSQPQTFSIS